MKHEILADGIEIYCADCLDVMRDMPDKSVPISLTDPPYGVGRDKGFEGFEGFGGFGAPIARTRYKGDWDKYRPDKVYFDELLRISDTALIFGGNYFADYLPVGNHWVVWDKKQTMPTFGDCELVWTNVKRNSVKWITREWNGLLGKEESREHATQKPLKIIKWLIVNYTESNQTILDPFMGSGTTGVSCVQTGRRFIGIEIDPDYYEIAKRRILDALSQPRLFDAPATQEIEINQQSFLE